MPTLEQLLDHAVPQTTPATDFDVLAARGTRRRHVKRGGATLAAIVLVLAVGWSVIPRGPALRIEPVAPESVGLWQPMADSPLGPRIQGQTAVDGSRLLFWGGEAPLQQDGYETHQVMYDGAIYDVALDEWTYIPTAPEPIEQPDFTILSDRRLALLGGIIQGELRTTSWVFDLDDQTWIPVDESPFELESSVRWLADSGGAIAISETGESARFDLDSATWRMLPPLPDPVEWNWVARGGDYVFAFGGTRDTERQIDEGDLVSDGWLLDLTTEEWKQVSSPLSGRTHPDVAWLDGRFLVLGGSGADVEGWEDTTSVTEGPETHECDGTQCSGSAEATISMTPGAPPEVRLDGAWFDPATGEWELLGPAVWAGTRLTGIKHLYFEALDDEHAYLGVKHVGGGNVVLIDVASDRTWDVDFPGAVGGYRMTNDTFVGIPDLFLPYWRGQAAREDDAHDVVVFRESDDDKVMGMQVAPPQLWGDMQVLVADGRVILWNGQRQTEDNETEWLDGGWVLDLSDEQYAFDRS